MYYNQRQTDRKRVSERKVVNEIIIIMQSVTDLAYIDFETKPTTKFLPLTGGKPEGFTIRQLVL